MKKVGRPKTINKEELVEKGVYITKEAETQLEERAKKDGRSFSYLASKVLNDFLKKRRE